MYASALPLRIAARMPAPANAPTTRVISILRHGDAGPPESAGDHTRIYRYPLDVLRDLEIVDTPGTNSIERMEEEITRGFVPRADLVLFVTSLLQPLTASELGFLGHISEHSSDTEGFQSRFGEPRFQLRDVE